MANEIQQFFRDHGISEVEAIIPDMAGIARGKLMPAEKFAEDAGMRLPESIFLQTVTGDYPSDTSSAMSPAEIDIVLKADPKTVRVVPWAAEPTAQVIHDCFYSDGRRVSMAPRQVLQHVLELYAERGWEPVVAPELEFYLVEPNIDADYQLKPPIGRSGRAEPGRQSYSIAAVNEFDPLFDDVYAFCEAQDIEIDTLIHEDGPAQMEINLLHGDRKAARRRDAEALDHPVARARLDAQAAAEFAHALAMERIHLQAFCTAREALQLPAGLEPDLMDGRVLALDGLIFRLAVIEETRHFMKFLPERAAEGNIDLLEATADPQHRHPVRHRPRNQRQGGLIAMRIVQGAGIARFPVIVVWLDVRRAPHEQQSVERVKQALVMQFPPDRRHDDRNRPGRIQRRRDVLFCRQVVGLWPQQASVGGYSDQWTFGRHEGGSG